MRLPLYHIPSRLACSRAAMRKRGRPRVNAPCGVVSPDVSRPLPRPPCNGSTPHDHHAFHVYVCPWMPRYFPLRFAKAMGGFPSRIGGRSYRVVSSGASLCRDDRRPLRLAARDDRGKLAMTAWTEFDDRALRLPRRPPVSARSRRALDANAMQASALNLFALGNGCAQSARDILPDDLLIAKASHKSFLPAHPAAVARTYAS